MSTPDHVTNVTLTAGIAMAVQADFVDIATFDKLAATCGEYLTKGREVAVASPHRNQRFQRGP